MQTINITIALTNVVKVVRWAVVDIGHLSTYFIMKFVCSHLYRRLCYLHLQLLCIIRGSTWVWSTRHFCRYRLPYFPYSSTWDWPCDWILAWTEQAWQRWLCWYSLWQHCTWVWVQLPQETQIANRLPGCWLWLQQHHALQSWLLLFKLWTEHNPGKGSWYCDWSGCGTESVRHTTDKQTLQMW